MKPEQVVDLIDKLVDERTKLVAITSSKHLGADIKKSFTEDCRKKIVELKTQLVDALKA